jgi:CYTH domain-containing protein
MLRFLPGDVRDPVSIIDRYINGTRLRLRRVEAPDHVDLKLGQKVRSREHEPETVKITNLYLSESEYRALAALDACELTKTRWTTTVAGRRFAIDQFTGRLDGLLLAETELTLGEARLEDPPFAIRDVTDDDRFSGGSLAPLMDDAAAVIVRMALDPTS